MSELMVKSGSAEYYLSFVNHLLLYCKTEIDRNLAFEVILCLMQEIKYNENQVDNLMTSVLTHGIHATGCIVISRASAIFINTVCLELPHVMYVRLWRWPDVKVNDLIHIDTCSFAFGKNYHYLCVNPYHYRKKMIRKESALNFQANQKKSGNKTSVQNQSSKNTKQSALASRQLPTVSTGAIPKKTSPKVRAILKRGNNDRAVATKSSQSENREHSSDGKESEVLRDSAVLAVVSVAQSHDEHGRPRPNQVNKQVKISFRHDDFEPNMLPHIPSPYGANASIFRSFFDTLGSLPTIVEIFDFKRDKP